MSKYLQRLAILWLWAGVAGYGFSASAFHLNDHEQITKQAYDEFAKCFPEAAARMNREALVQGDLEEDLNLVVKYIFYSHFYNPSKKLNMWRDGSHDRVEDLAPYLMQCRSGVESWSNTDAFELGHVIHHFQDMAVPAHVVPVHHSGWDGFEVYKVTGDISSELSCAEIATLGGEGLEAILKETALTTLAAVADYHVEAVDPGTRAVLEFAGVDFWREAQGDGFGTYGTLGNAFGKTEIASGPTTLQISEDSFRIFKRQQLKSAVRATLSGLRWALPQSEGFSYARHTFLTGN